MNKRNFGLAVEEEIVIEAGLSQHLSLRKQPCDTLRTKKRDRE